MKSLSELIGQQRQTTLQTHRDNSLSLLQDVSQKQREDMSRFKSQYPTSSVVIQTFSPPNWGVMLGNVDKCIKAPYVTFKQLDKMYDFAGSLSQKLIQEQLIGIYSITAAKEAANYNSMNLVSSLFCAKYGNICTPFTMMLYFGNYITEYKSSYSQFDAQDIIQQYNRKFLPWYQKAVSEHDNNEDKPQQTGIVGKEALVEYLSKILRNGGTINDLKETNLYKMGMCDDKDIEQAVIYAQEYF